MFKNKFNITDMICALTIGIAITKAYYNEAFLNGSFPIAMMFLAISTISNQAFKISSSNK